MIATLLALAVAGQASSSAGVKPPAAAPAASTSQQRFDAATAAVEAGRCTEALAAFDALAATTTAKRNGLLVAAMDVRRGRCLVRLGRTAEGAAAIGRGLPALEARGESFAGDVSLAHLTLGDLAMGRLDYDEAIRHYTASADAVKGGERIVPLMRLSQVTMFDPDDRAVAAADEARRLATLDPGYGKKNLAVVQSQYARVLLNKDRAAEAYTVLKDSLAKQGGLTTRVGIADLATRSDLAIAALLNKRLDDARLYLAYTGAGRMTDAPFGHAVAMAAPSCGEGGITTADRAVVEFTIETDGRVSSVYPIYATGGRRAAVAFAGAVRNWSWKAEDVAKIPALFRYATRVELRCSKARDGNGIMTPLNDAVRRWFDSRLGPPPWLDLSDAAAMPVQRAALDRARASGDQPGIARAALALRFNGVVSGTENATLIAAAAAAVAAAGAPASVVNYVALYATDTKDDIDRYRDVLRALLARPGFANDPLSASTVRLLLASPIGRKPPPPDAAALLTVVTDDPSLPANDPLKVAALLGRANILAAGGDLAGAKAAFARTGLTGEQCAQLGLSPARRSTGSGGSYPVEAQPMGFEGWVMAEADVLPDGRTATQRATVSYPPFVFDEAAVNVAKGVRYSSSFRPDGALACEGVRMPVVFATGR